MYYGICIGVSKGYNEQPIDVMRLLGNEYEEEEEEGRSDQGGATGKPAQSLYCSEYSPVPRTNFGHYHMH
jgi:hypothetical protein